jgi:Uma2 family endonuclease
MNAATARTAKGARRPTRKLGRTMLTTSRPHRFSVEEYMASGVPGHTELVDGVIYEVSPRNPPHSNAVRVLIEYLAHGLDRNVYAIQVQDPIAVAGWKGHHAPEIDLAVVFKKRYETIPEAADTFAAIEVSDTTYLDDRNVKIPLYAAAGIPAWIVNIPERRVEFYGPERRDYHEGEIFEILDVVIPVAELV